MNLRLPPTAAFLLLASLTVSFLAGSSAPTPLYGVYMAEWGLTPLLVTVIFGIYALAVLVAACRPITPPNGDEVAIFEGETRLNALMFWLPAEPLSLVKP